MQIPAAIGPQPGADANIFETPAARAAGISAEAGSERVGQGQGPHKLLSRGIGSAMAGLVSSVNLGTGKQVAEVIDRHLQTLTNSTTGTPLGIQPVRGPVNGPANIEEGIAIISGKRAGG